MRLVHILSCLLVLVLGPLPAQAQTGGTWVQIEAQPSLVKAQERARAYAARLDHVAGFALGNGWYSIALGPYARSDAEALLVNLRGAHEIPSDSYISDGSSYDRQFWPVGAGASLSPQPLPEGAGADDGVAVVDAPPAPDALPDETRAEALASEILLSQAQKEQLQIALQWAGSYAGAIDGAYGRGTRAAMEDWQRMHGHDATGVLTTRQRAELLTAYNAVLEGLDLATVRDDAAGIEILMPQAVVAFSRYEPPFALYDARDGGVAQVILISQEGDAQRLAGLYEIMQTLEIVPPDGPRERRSTSFTLEGMDARLHSRAFAQVADGHVKGFVLVWPAGDEARFERLLAEMQASFAVTGTVLDPGIAPPDEDQSIDLVSGLAIRQPHMNRAGAFINDAGEVLTSAAAVAECREITIAGGHPARVAFSDPGLGIAVLAPEERLAPGGVVAFQTQTPRLQSQVAVAGFPYGAALTQPVLTFGTLADIRGLNGESGLRRLALNARAGDAGGPVFDNGGAVVGMLLPAPDATAQALPADVAFARSAGDIVAALEAAGIAVTTTDRIAFIEAATLTRQAAGVGVLVSCW
ncbi:MAG: trypsin-like peptidase domain-containing protein [Rubellimicrobium sp.]|nr:trypsin-like peptidase domain-containing protein [Rubellimicrobium sp.]